MISGGYETLILSKEGVEDRVDEAVNDLKKINFCADDFLIGIAASVRTPYTLAGLEYAISISAKSAFIICNKSDFLKIKPDVIIDGIDPPQARQVYKINTLQVAVIVAQ